MFSNRLKDINEQISCTVLADNLEPKTIIKFVLKSPVSNFKLKSICPIICERSVNHKTIKHLKTQNFSFINEQFTQMCKWSFERIILYIKQFCPFFNRPTVAINISIWAESFVYVLKILCKLFCCKIETIIWPCCSVQNWIQWAFLNRASH